MIQKGQIETIVDIIKENYHPERILLFGSYAYGKPTDESDLDILIIKDVKIPRFKRALEVRKHLRGLKVPMDIVVYNQDEINNWADVKGSFIHQVMTNGMVMYERK